MRKIDKVLNTVGMGPVVFDQISKMIPVEVWKRCSARTIAKLATALRGQVMYGRKELVRDAAELLGVSPDNFWERLITLSNQGAEQADSK